MMCLKDLASANDNLTEYIRPRGKYGNNQQGTFLSAASLISRQYRCRTN